MHSKKGHFRTHCIRCGECCRTSSPSLEAEDLHLLRDGILRNEHLITIRKGEGVRDNIREEFTILSEEIVKIKEKGGVKGGCLFYDEESQSCTIYDQRPSQCVALKCWDSIEFERVFQGTKLTRGTILGNNPLMRLIQEHERKCSYGLIGDLVKQIATRGEGAVRDILAILRYDFELRILAREKLPLHPAEMDFFFGRPLLDTIPIYGLEVLRDSNGGFLLTTLGSSSNLP